MSRTIIAMVVVGFQAELRQEFVSKTKYNADSGEPYTVKEHSYDSAICDGKIIATNAIDVDCFCAGSEISGLEVFDAGYGPENRIWIGSKLANVNYEPGSSIVDFAIPMEVVKFGEAYGISPRTYLILYIG
jgi:hypothetical protein